MTPHTGEYIEDTEEYINIELDSSRNRLIRLEIVLTGATFSLALWNLVAGALLARRLHGGRCSCSGRSCMAGLVCDSVLLGIIL